MDAEILSFKEKFKIKLSRKLTGSRVRVSQILSSKTALQHLSTIFKKDAVTWTDV